MKKAKNSFNKRLKILAGILGGFILVMLALIMPELIAGGAILASVPIWGVFSEGSFTELKAEDVAKLDPTEQIKYFNELNLHKADKIDKLKKKIQEENKEEVEKQIRELREEVQSDILEQTKSLTTALEKQGLAITKLLHGQGQAPAKKSIEDHLREKAEDIAKADRKSVTIKTDVTTASITNSTISHRLPGVGQLATRRQKLIGLFATGTLADGEGGVVRYIDQSAVTRNADFKDEAAQKPESAITWVELTMPLEYVADTIPVTKQALTNISWMATEINNFLLKNLALKVDASLATGTGVAPQIFGPYTRADTYTAAASGIADANLYDLISLMKSNITDDSEYDPNYILINPTDRVKYLQLKKDANNNYILPPWVEMRNGMMFIDNMQVIETSTITADTFMIGDFDYATVYTHGGVQLEVGYVANQFIENMVTVRAEQEIGMLIRNAHTDAFNKCTGIAAALVTIAS